MNNRNFYAITFFCTILSCSSVSAGWWYERIFPAIFRALGYDNNGCNQKQTEKILRDQLAISNDLIKDLASNPGAAQCAEKLGELVDVGRETNAVLTEGKDALKDTGKASLQTLGMVVSLYYAAQESRSAAVSARKWLFPTEKEKEIESIETKERKISLEILTARSEFNKCILLNRAAVAAVDDVPEICREKRKIYLLLTNKQVRQEI